MSLKGVSIENYGGFCKLQYINRKLFSRAIVPKMLKPVCTYALVMLVSNQNEQLKMADQTDIISYQLSVFLTPHSFRLTVTLKVKT